MKRLARFLPAVLALALVSTVAVGQRYATKESSRVVDGGAAGSAASAGTSAGTRGAAAANGSSAGSANAALPNLPGYVCTRGGNGGSTDVGVSASAIKLGATVVKSGIGQSFLGEVPIALEAVKNQVNRSGGICGRLLDLEMADDGWDAARGQQYIKNFIDSGKFALAVSPSSEGLDAAIRNGDIRRAGIPVVGADGMLISQYTDPWVWPVAASTMTTMHVMAKHAAARGAQTFGLVYDTSYSFGVEGASAFRGALKRLFPGRKVLLADKGIEAYQPNYKNAVGDFNQKCDPCDFVAMLLEPPTALQWIRDGGSFGRVLSGGPQPLFVDAFARSCANIRRQNAPPPCNGFWVWTGYVPPVPPFDDLPGVAAYARDVRFQRSTVDVSNPFVEGGYLGMRLLVKALREVGPYLTRARLKAVLDRTTLDEGLTVPLRWTEGHHFANDAVQAFSIVINNGSFTGWQYERTGWIKDPWIGLDAPRR